jgi:hypothetical protein
LTQLYGQGVHRFNRGDYSAARQLFDEAILHGSQDPRCYYFRGMAQLRMGCGLEADADFQMAAQLELQGRGTYDVGRALERVQGYDRLRLERVRLRTQLTLTPASVPPAAQPTAPRVPAEAGQPAVDLDEFDLAPDASDPFATETEPMPPPSEPAEEAVEPAERERDPFADEPAPAEPPPAAEPPPRQPGPDQAPGEDPFGEEADEGAEAEDPFAPDAAPPQPQAADEDPFGENDGA